MIRSHIGPRVNMQAIEPAPADCPISVIFRESPPKAAMFCFTHAIAASWSNKPTLAVSPGTYNQPSAASL
ncbi:hypothetical protein MASR1M50_18290 [Burkholderiales bacterium]